MLEINYQPIFDYIDDQTGQIREQVMNELNPKFNQIFDILDRITKDKIIYHEEMAVMRYRVDRLENWAKPAGDKISQPLNL